MQLGAVPFRRIMRMGLRARFVSRYAIEFEADGRLILVLSLSDNRR